MKQNKNERHTNKTAILRCWCQSMDYLLLYPYAGIGGRYLDASSDGMRQ